MKNSVWSKIKNGLKKAVTFVVDVLLFIPRFIINGIKGFFNKEEAESEKLDEEFDDDAEEIEKPVEAEEPKQEETVVETTEEDKSNSVEVTDKNVEEKIPVAAAKEPQVTESIPDKAEEPKQEETVVETTEEDKSNSVEVIDDKAEEKSEAEKPVEAAEEPKQEETKDQSTAKKTAEVTEEPQKSKKNNKKASAKTTTTKVEKVAAEVIDSQTGKVVKDNVDVEASTGEKEMPVFAKTDKKAAPFEKGFITYFNGAVKKYNKSLWLDGATEIQKFAKAYLDAIAIKENINAPKDETRYDGIMKALKDAKIMSDADETFLRSCLGKQYFQGTENVQERLNAVYMFMGNYQLYYYPEWCASVKPQPFNPDGVATA